MKPICEFHKHGFALSSSMVWCWLIRHLCNYFPFQFFSKIAPTVILDAPKDSVIMNEEIFGPLLPIITVKVVKLIRFSLGRLYMH